jgi:hypothetical protein
VAGLPEPFDDARRKLPGQRGVGKNCRHGWAQSVDREGGTPILLDIDEGLSPGKSIIS